MKSVFSFRVIAGVFTSLLLFFSHSSHAVNVRVVALFPDKALVFIDGERQFLKVGQQPVKGVQLIDASSRKARLEINGVAKDYFLSRDMGNGIQSPELLTFRINRSNDGQYLAQGVINNNPVQVLIDTGANVVAINSATADRLGIRYRDGSAVRVETASGVVRGFRVMLGFVSVGGIRVVNVEATVIEGGSPENVLLGMSYLKNIRFSEEGGVMTLEAPY
ncbi:TIGR02281 family clan AA aspartic protease [Endozoicomonas sp. 8E]|uniref:retropepsin-like aspartic protease family protein n=1 Tax=Endozoicomonas sp. 8E TaxID=3035692 RepID=UPI0029394FCC|nr:TIGR02281 family clan AA aspartic protease [Endozoicomonas sp. 8E]WOG27299.1 TIGR02281 family clan AA aspartic protease [Endozoicomonas sp. 8E]